MNIQIYIYWKQVFIGTEVYQHWLLKNILKMRLVGFVLTPVGVCRRGYLSLCTRSGGNGGSRRRIGGGGGFGLLQSACSTYK